MERTVVEPWGAEALLGTLFTTAKELRHLAEQNLGQLFVPTEVVTSDERSAELVLRPQGMREIRVRAERDRYGYPYRITRVDTRPAHAPA